jgi:o-succinylbenzoate synthase
MLRAEYKKHVLYFKRPAGTSRGVLRRKTSFYITVRDDENPEIKGVGECSTIKGLSIDPWDRYEEKLGEVCRNINYYTAELQEGLNDFPSIRFGLETALFDFQRGGRHILFPSDFTSGRGGIKINGLIWMGSFDFMKQQIKDKLDKGFECIKIKIGAIDFDSEIELLKMIRKEYGNKVLELRTDANGAFSPREALEKLKRLSDFDIHSIEQPISQNQWEEMARLCENSPVPIALDEELIGINSEKEISKMLDTIKPQYIILKPSLIGGFAIAKRYITEAEKRDTGWWLTSALESNIGLNALAQWIYQWENPLPQGLGTGQLFTNNIESPLYLDNDTLMFDPDAKWGDING